MRPDLQPVQTKCRRSNHTARRLVILGNHLCMWAGIPATTDAEKQAIVELFNAWDAALLEIRKENANNLS